MFAKKSHNYEHHRYRKSCGSANRGLHGGLEPWRRGSLSAECQNTDLDKELRDEVLDLVRMKLFSDLAHAVL